MRLVIPALFVALVSMPLVPAVAGDDPAKLEEAKALLAAMAGQRKASDAAGLLESFKKVVELHNALEDKSTKGKLQKEVGSVLKTKKLADAHAAAVSTLGALDDSKGAWKQLKKQVPDPKEEEMSDLGGKVLAAVGKLAPDSALGTLYELAEKAKDHAAGAAAITALGNFGKSKKRVGVLETLIKLLGRFKPSRTSDKVPGEAARKRWEKLGPPLITALNTLTGQKVRDPDEWLGLYKEFKKRPKDLFVDE